MGMHLRGRERDAYLSMTLWSDLLYVAVRYGWQPRGTKPAALRLLEPKPESTLPEWNPDLTVSEDGLTATYTDWGGWYVSNSGQLVTPEDARSLGDALAEFQADAKGHYRTCDDGLAVTLADVVSLCRQGGFAIW